MILLPADQTVTGFVFSYLLMIPFDEIGMVTGKTDGQTTSWFKRGLSPFLLIIPLMKIGIVTGKTESQTASWLKRG
jgi:hypothetical protein